MISLLSLKPGLLLAGFVIVIFSRPRRREHARLVKIAPEQIPSAIPENAKIAGVSLHIVLSDRSGPGAVLRDHLMTGPPPSP